MASRSFPALSRRQAGTRSSAFTMWIPIPTRSSTLFLTTVRPLSRPLLSEINTRIETANKSEPSFQIDPVWQPYYSARRSYGSYLDPPFPDDAPLNATFWHRVTEVFERNEYVLGWTSIVDLLMLRILSGTGRSSSSSTCVCPEAARSRTARDRSARTTRSACFEACDQRAIACVPVPPASPFVPSHPHADLAGGDPARSLVQGPEAGYGRASRPAPAASTADPGRPLTGSHRATTGRGGQSVSTGCVTARRRVFSVATTRLLRLRRARPGKHVAQARQWTCGLRFAQARLWRSRVTWSRSKDEIRAGVSCLDGSEGWQRRDRR